MKAAGIIFSNIHDKCIPELTKPRTMASVPFGGRYRFVDFALSNFVNSDITTVGIITHNNYQSLLDHIGTGKDWDLSRRSGGIKILPPYVTSYTNTYANMLYTTRLEALMGIVSFIQNVPEEYLVLTDCNMISNIDFNQVLKKHEEKSADITIIVKKINTNDLKFPLDNNIDILSFDKNSRVVDYLDYDSQSGELYINTCMLVVTKTYLMSIINESIARGYKSFAKEIIVKNLHKDKIYAYVYDGYYDYVDSLQKYFYCSMQLLNRETSENVFSVKNRPIYTKVRNTPPTRYTKNATVKNSIIADGCVIEGTVENSILFRGVKVGKNTIIKNSILLQNTYTGDDVYLNCVITDKDVTIKDSKMLSGHETLPFYINKGTTI